MKRNQQALLDLMHKYRIKCPDVAAILNCKSNTVRIWRCNSGLSIPDSKLELLTFKLGVSDE